MRLKLLLFLVLLTGGLLQAQDTIPYRQLLITEAYLGSQDLGYFEITNVGNEDVQLSEFKFAEMRPWGDPRWSNPADRWWILPDHILKAGESFVLAGILEFGPNQFKKGLDGYTERGYKADLAAIAAEKGEVIYRREANGDETDLVHEMATAMWNDISGGRSCMFLQHNLSETDTVVVDQVNGWFDGDNGLNIDKGGYDIAGVTKASANSYLIRKFSVKTGNLEFAAGIGEDDGEWIVVKREGGTWRDAMWTVGNHGDYKLDENTLESDVADVDFANKVITVPWGTLRADGIMHLMKKKPGIAWNYVLSPAHEDSLSFGAKTGDQLLITVCGNTGYRATFDIVVAPPTADANTVVPVTNETPNGDWRDDVEQGLLGWPRVTAHEAGNDSIWGSRGGIPYATRIDTLLERLEKPANASWEIEYVDGVPHPDAVDGDKLVITSENGTVKKYHIAVLPWRHDHNAQLASITFPDLPAFYQGIFGWVGDTIPSFGPTVYNYRLNVPVDVEGIPALVAKPQNPNAKVSVKRATNLAGSLEDRTITFTVTAEDDTTFRHYSIELVKEKNPMYVQPYHADPILSELVFWEQWSNSFGELFNPGNQPLDLSNYMIAMEWNGDPSGVIQSRMDPGEWLDRFDKYVPGYKWVDEATWAVTPGILVQDLNVNPILMPGDVFAFGGIWTENFSVISWDPSYKWHLPENLDVQFNNFNGNHGGVYKNPWNEAISGNGTPIRKWSNSEWYMFKILNDSIKQGLKPANDPNDFELIEWFGMGDVSNWVVGGVSAGMITNYMRKPEIFKGNPEAKGSFGTNRDDCEWTWTNQAYWDNLNAGWPYNIMYVGNDIGKHFAYAPTHYMSTVSSVVYKVSPGYSVKESIRGMQPGVTASDFLSNIIKSDEMQTLKVKGVSGELAMDALLSMNDTLVVMSADSTNTTKYILEVAEGGLSANAVLTSSRYEITIVSQPKSAGNENAGTATIKGFEYGTSLKTLLANITVPVGASMDIVDGEGVYIPLKRLNFDTTYVNVTVNDNTYFDVIAENGVTEIVYQLLPYASEQDAFITSDVYSVVQKDVLIKFVPRGTNVGAFLANLVPSAGASIKLVNNMGQERVDGYVADDDKVVVTSPNGMYSTVYYISRLAEKYVPEVTYLAYILSSTYKIDQVSFKINGVSGAATIADFYAKITASMGAAAVVVDKDGNQKAAGDINGSDMVKVTSADGKIEVMYTFGPLTSSGIVEDSNIQLYPNPTTGKINISGVEAGNRIQVYNSVGAAIRDINVQRNIETISLDREPAGMYMIVVSDSNKLLGRYKAVKK